MPKLILSKSPAIAIVSFTTFIISYAVLAVASPTQIEINSTTSRANMIEAYREAAVQTGELTEEAASAFKTLARLSVPERLSIEVQEAINIAAITQQNTRELEREFFMAVAYESALISYKEITHDAENAAIFEARLLEAAATKDMPNGEALDALKEFLDL